MKNVSIRWRFILVFLLALLPVCGLIVVLQSNFFAIMKNQASMYTARTIEKVSYDIELTLSELDKMALALQHDPALRQALSTEDTAAAQQCLNEVMQQNALAQSTGSAILLLNGSQRILASTYTEWTGLLRMLGAQWLHRIVNSGGGRVLISGYSITKGQQLTPFKVLSLARGIFEEGKLLGYLMVEVPTEAIAKLCEGVSLGQNGFVALVDGDDYVIYNTNAASIGSKFMHIDNLSHEYSYQETTIYNMKMLLVDIPATVSGIRVIGAIPMSELEQELIVMRRGAACAIIVIMLAAFAVVTMVTKRLCRPILEMEKAMKQVEKGDFSIRVSQNRSDEIGSLQRGFNHMVDQVNHLIAREYIAALRHREAQLNEMMAIINPHFIYNTLEAISMTAFINGDDDAVDMIGRLGDIFRAMTSDHGSRMLTLRQELKTVEDYLALINVRQDGKIHVSIQVDESLLDTSIMKFTLQPIVENSVLHGFNIQQGGNIWIHVQSGENNDVLIAVEDDGIGVDEEMLKHLRQVLTDEEPSPRKRPMALKNVHDRLCLTFGSEYGLTLDSRPGGGLIVRVRIPFQSCPKNETEV